MDNCMWVAAGYPVLITAIVALWTAYNKSNEMLLKERHSSEQVWAYIDKIVAERIKKREETRRGGPHDPAQGRGTNR